MASRPVRGPPVRAGTAWRATSRERERTGAHEPRSVMCSQEQEARATKSWSSPGSGRVRQAAPDLQPARQRSRDERCPGGSGWGEALVSGSPTAATRRTIATCQRAGHASGLRAAGEAGGAGGESSRPLARDDPAGDGRSNPQAEASARSARVEREPMHRRHLDGAVDVVDGAPTPSVQRELGERRRRRRTRDRRVRGWCSQAVLIANVGGDAGGRRPGSGEVAAFDEAAAARGLAAASVGRVERPGSSGAVATEDVRRFATCSRVADKAAGGRDGAGGPSIEALQDHAVSDPGARNRGSGFEEVARWVVARPKLEVRRQAKLHPRVHPTRCRTRREPGSVVAGWVQRPEGREAERSSDARGARSGIGQRAGCTCRTSVADVGEAHLPHQHGGARGDPRDAGQRRGSSKRPTSP